MKLRTKVRSTLFILPFVAGSALATNGYFTHGLGVKNKAMAGAGTANPEEAMSIANNPAASVQLGDTFQVGMAIFSPRREYSASSSMANGNGGAFTLAEGTVSSDSNYFPIPYVALSRKINDTSAWGFAAYGRGGMNTNYETGGAAIFDPDGPGAAPVMIMPGPFGAGEAGVDLSQLFTEFNYSWKKNSLSIGVAAVLSAQIFEAKGIATFTPYTKDFAASGGTAMPTTLSNNGYDLSWGYGAKVGLLWTVNPQLQLGLAYQSKISMDEFGDYKNLFAQGGGFDIPESMRFAVSYQFSPLLALHYDLESTQFDQVPSVGNPLANIYSCPTAGMGGMAVENCLGGSNGAGFGWDSVTVHKFGLAWQSTTNSSLTWRAGISMGDNPVKPENALFNILAPGVIKQHITAGVDYQLDNGRELSLAVMYAPEESLEGSNAFDPTQRIGLRMKQFEIEFALNW